MSAIQAGLEENGYRVKSASTTEAALEIFYSAANQCTIFQFSMSHHDGFDFLRVFKSGNVFGRSPLILILDDVHTACIIDWEQVMADDYVVWPCSTDEIASRIRLCMSRASRDVNANPLTGMPGNLPILRESERRLRSRTPFALGHFDINNFKAFNDKYGFHRGDEVLRMTARLLENIFIELGTSEAYVGHLGGDDFIFLLPSEIAEPACIRMCRQFESISLNFYDDDDRTQGFIHSHDRQGNPCDFPLMSCSIGVVDTASSTIEHIADLGTRAAQVKGFAKSMPGSNFIIDRRA